MYFGSGMMMLGRTMILIFFLKSAHANTEWLSSSKGKQDSSLVAGPATFEGTENKIAVLK